MLYWPEAKHRANTADRGPVTGPIRNYLINNIIVLLPCQDINRDNTGQTRRADRENLMSSTMSFNQSANDMDTHRSRP